MRVPPDYDPFTGVSQEEMTFRMPGPKLCPDYPGEDLKRVLPEGAAWETSTGDTLDQFAAATIPSKKKSCTRKGWERRAPKSARLQMLWEAC